VGLKHFQSGFNGYGAKVNQGISKIERSQGKIPNNQTDLEFRFVGLLLFVQQNRLG